MDKRKDRARVIAEMVAVMKSKNAHVSPAEFLDRLVFGIDVQISDIRRNTEGHEDERTFYAHRLPRATWLQVEPLLLEVAKILRAATVIPAPAGMAAARSDDGFQRFLAEQCIPGLDP